MSDSIKKYGSDAIQDIKCPRCGDLFYDPKVMIKDAQQHAAEWEQIARAYSLENRIFGIRIAELEKQLEALK